MERSLFRLKEVHVSCSPTQRFSTQKENRRRTLIDPTYLGRAADIPDGGISSR